MADTERIGFGPRLGAYLIDVIVIIVGGLIVGGLVGGLIGAGAGGASGGEEGAVGGGILGAILGAAAGIGLLGILWGLWEGVTGAALGKLLLGLKIGDAAGKTADTGKLLFRAALKYSSTILAFLAALTGAAILATLGNLAGLVIFIGCFFCLGRGRQALHDRIAKTAVFRKAAL